MLSAVAFGAGRAAMRPGDVPPRIFDRYTARSSSLQEPHPPVSTPPRKWPALAILVVVAGVAASVTVSRHDEDTANTRGDSKPTPVAVELADVERGTIREHRVFSATVEAGAQFVVAPKVGGRLQRITVDLADTVTRGQIVAQLDDAEYRQAVAQANAELTVARAELAAARHALTVAKRTRERVEALHGRKVASEQEFDAVQADELSAQAQTQVAAARVQRAHAAHQAAKVRADYTQVRAEWPDDDRERVVAARFADEGETVGANAQLLSIVDLDPVVVVVHATEVDYAALETGQRVDLTTDAYPDHHFSGTVSRIAPVFRSESRQARVEIRAENPERRLRPGMFVRAKTVVREMADATIVPEPAVVRREGRDVVFVVTPDGRHVEQREVTLGIRDENTVQVVGGGIEGRVVVLGQQQLHDGSELAMPRPTAKPPGDEGDA